MSIGKNPLSHSHPHRSIIANFRLCAVLATLLSVTACGVEPSKITEECIDYFGDSDACACADKKLHAAVGAEDYDSYVAFMDLFFARQQSHPDENGVEHWYQAARAYSNATGQEAMQVEGDMSLLSSAHQNAIRACGLDPSIPREEPEPAPEPAAKTTEPRATLTLDGQSYDFDFVMCAPGAGGTTMLVASDKANRPEYPTVRTSVFPNQPPDSNMHTLSADFQNAQPRTLWLLDGGQVEKTDKNITASGHLQGSQMVPQPDGINKPVVISENGRKTFELDASCR
ncbi:MAG: hypothetical protein AAF351_14940 [Pseudomonadota bacterium]